MRMRIDLFRIASEDFIPSLSNTWEEEMEFEEHEMLERTPMESIIDESVSGSERSSLLTGRANHTVYEQTSDNEEEEELRVGSIDGESRWRFGSEWWDMNI